MTSVWPSVGLTVYAAGFTPDSSQPARKVRQTHASAPLHTPRRAPESTVMDETFKIAITRLGDRIRVGGMAEISAFSTDLPDKRRATLEMSVGDLFPGATYFGPPSGRGCGR